MAMSNINVTAIISSETLANSLGATGLTVGTLVANTCQVSNQTANGSLIRFTVVGASLPVVFGSETIYPPVLMQVYAGANGNATDTLLASGNIIPTIDQGGAFVATGQLVFRANAKTAVNAVGGGCNTGWGGVVSIPGAALGGGVKTVTNLVVGAASNGNVNVVTSTSNTANISFYFASQTGQNTNASISLILVETCNAQTGSQITSVV